LGKFYHLVHTGTDTGQSKGRERERERERERGRKKERGFMSVEVATGAFERSEVWPGGERKLRGQQKSPSHWQIQRSQTAPDQ
jgi:ribosomal protein L19E